MPVTQFASAETVALTNYPLAPVRPKKPEKPFLANTKERAVFDAAMIVFATDTTKVLSDYKKQMDEYQKIYAKNLSPLQAKLLLKADEKADAPDFHSYFTNALKHLDECYSQFVKADKIEKSDKQALEETHELIKGAIGSLNKLIELILRGTTIGPTHGKKIQKITKIKEIYIAGPQSLKYAKELLLCLNILGVQSTRPFLAPHILRKKIKEIISSVGELLIPKGKESLLEEELQSHLSWVTSEMFKVIFKIIDVCYEKQPKTLEPIEIDTVYGKYSPPNANATPGSVSDAKAIDDPAHIVSAQATAAAGVVAMQPAAALRKA